MIGARSANPVRRRVTRGEHQYGSEVLCVAQPFEDLPAADSRQHYIQEDDRIGAITRHLETGQPVRSDFHMEPLFLQPFLDLLGDPFFVFNEQNAHLKPSPGGRPRPSSRD